MQTYLTLLFELVFATGGGALLLTFVVGLINLWRRCDPDQQTKGAKASLPERAIQQATDRITDPAADRDTALEAATEVIDEFLRQPAEEPGEPAVDEKAVEAIAAEVLAEAASVEAEPGDAEPVEAEIEVTAAEPEPAEEDAIVSAEITTEQDIAAASIAGSSAEGLPVEASIVPGGPDKLEDLGETETLEELGPRVEEKVPLEPIPMGKLKRTEVQKQQELVDETN